MRNSILSTSMLSNRLSSLSSTKKNNSPTPKFLLNQLWKKVTFRQSHARFFTKIKTRNSFLWLTFFQIKSKR